ncbi:MAG: hypothetical protein ACP5I6_02650 [Caldisphaera sp.]|jgi:hypothetical protein|nr:MAG: hypothetical protein C0201_03040 [Caldisphaera sp.]PMP88241.1 MAG: hypothetical protein C0172_03140 [Caldisphaera sp.]
MPRKGRKKDKHESKDKNLSNNENKKTNNKGKKSKKQPKLSNEELEKFVEDISNELIGKLGLDLIGLNPEDIKNIVEEVIISISESRVTKPSEESIIKKVLLSKEQFMKSIASILLEEGKINDRERLEFLIAYAPDIAGKATPILYQIAKKLNANDIIESLRQLWNMYGKPTPIKCPRCGFNSVMPDLTCIICGAILDEKEIKESLDFQNSLKDLTRHYNTRLIEEIINSGYVIYDGEIKPPSLLEKDRISIAIHLNKNEKDYLKALISNLA